MKRGHISARLNRWVRIRARNVCEYCRLTQEFQEATFHVDHVVPIARNGKTAIDNLALACVSCSLRKGARLLPFNPRFQKWSDHFGWTSDWHVRGKTAAGRATVMALRMNSSYMIAIRKLLAENGRFPSG